MGFYSDAKYESSKKLNESIEKKKYLKEDAENSGHFIFKRYDNLPPRIVSTDNGAYDLEQKGLSGRYTWIGYQHKSMRTEQGMRQAVEDAANEIARRMKDEFGGDVKVEDKWKTTDMYRVYSVKELTESIRSRKALKEDAKSTLVIPGNVRTVPKQTYFNREDLVDVVIEEGVIAIEDYAFSGCSNLKSIKLPNSLTEIGAGAFSDCGSLESINIPPQVDYIDMWAFSKCANLKEVHAANLKAWCNIEFATADANPLYHAHNLYLNNNLVKNITAEMLQGVTEIKYDAFRNCESLESVEIPSSITSIDEGAFAYCKNLTKAVVHNKRARIHKNAFYGCNKLPEVLKEACRRRTEAFERRDFNDIRVVERSGEIQIGWPSYGTVSISEAKSFARDLQNAIDYAERQF